MSAMESALNFNKCKKESDKVRQLFGIWHRIAKDLQRWTIVEYRIRGTNNIWNESSWINGVEITADVGRNEASTAHFKQTWP